MLTLQEFGGGFPQPSYYNSGRYIIYVSPMLNRCTQEPVELSSFRSVVENEHLHHLHIYVWGNRKRGPYNLGSGSVYWNKLPTVVCSENSLNGRYIIYSHIQRLLEIFSKIKTTRLVLYHFCTLNSKGKKFSTENSLASESGIPKELNKSMFSSQYCWILPGSPVKIGWNNSGYL